MKTDRLALSPLSPTLCTHGPSRTLKKFVLCFILYVSKGKWGGNDMEWQISPIKKWWREAEVLSLGGPRRLEAGALQEGCPPPLPPSQIE
jgi:hypothetical protein